MTNLSLFAIRESRIAKGVLRPQDLLLLLRLSLLQAGERRSLNQLASDLSMSVSEVHAGVKRAKASRLIVHLAEGDVINKPNLFEFVVHGVKYWLPPRRGQLTRGVPTAHAAPPLVNDLVSDGPPPVWPHPQGQVRGEAFEPIYRSAPDAALNNPDLYELLALVDAIRGGQARERKLAIEYLKAELLA